MRDFVKGRSIRKGESHCSRLTASLFPGAFAGALALSHYLRFT